MEAIRLLISYVINHDMNLYKMDVKSEFLNGVIYEHVFKLKKSLYGLKQAPRAWYERLSNFRLENGFQKGQVNTTLFRKTLKNEILIFQVNVDDIIFCSTNATLCKEFSKSMQAKFVTSMMR